MGRREGEIGHKERVMKQAWKNATLLATVLGLMACGGSGTTTPLGDPNPNERDRVLPDCADDAVDDLTGCWLSDQCVTVNSAAGQWSRYVLSFTADKTMHGNQVYYSDSSCTGPELFSVMDIGGIPDYRIGSAVTTTAGLPANILLWDSDTRQTVFNITVLNGDARMCFLEGHYDGANGLDANAQVTTDEPYALALAACVSRDGL